MSQCVFILSHGPNKGNQCKNKACKISKYCSRHKHQTEKRVINFDLLELPTDLIPEIGKFLDYRDGISFTKVNKEIRTIFYAPNKNAFMWNAWFISLQSENDKIPNILDTKTQKYIIAVCYYNECQQCLHKPGKLYPELLVCFCRNCLFALSLSRTKLISYYKIPRERLLNIKSFNMRFSYGATGEFFLIKHVEEDLKMSIDQYRENSMRKIKEDRKQIQKEHSIILAQQKQIRLCITKNVLNLLNDDAEMKNIGITRLKRFNTIKNIRVDKIQNADEFDAKQMNIVINNIKYEYTHMLNKKQLIESDLSVEIPSFEHLILRNQLIKLSLLKNTNNRNSDNWLTIKNLIKIKTFESQKIDDQLQERNDELTELIEITRERISFAETIKRELEQRNIVIINRFAKKLRSKCRKEELKVNPELKTNDGRRKALIKAFSEANLQLRSDSKLCKSYIGGCENPLGEVIAITKMTSFLFSYSHIHFSNFHEQMKSELLRYMYENRNAKDPHNWTKACFEVVKEMRPIISHFQPPYYHSNYHSNYYSNYDYDSDHEYYNY